MQINAELSSAFLERVITELSDLYESTPRGLLELAEDHEMKVLLASAWQSEGVTLSPPVAYEVEIFRRRFEGHRKLFAEMKGRVESLEVVKGNEIGDLYPEGWVRGGKDMDLRAPNQNDLWKAAAVLQEKGWTCSTIFVQRVEGTDNVIAVMKGDSLDPMFMRPEVVEIGCMAFMGNFFGLRPALAASIDPATPKTALHLLGVLEQRLERKLVGRDVMDAVVLLERMDAADLSALWSLVDGLDSWKEWGHLVLVLDYLDIAGEDKLMPGGGRPRRRRASIRRGTRAVLRGVRPSVLVRSLVHKVSVRRWNGRLAMAAANFSGKMIHPTRILAAGLPLVGIPVDPRPAGKDVTTEVVGRRLVVRCPLGTYLAIYGHEYEPEWIGEVRSALGMPRDADA